MTGEEGEGFCQDCAKDLDVPAMPSRPDLGSNFLFVRCSGCGLTIVDKDGRCQGLMCKLHDRTPKWKRAWRRIRWQLRQAKYWLVSHTIRRYHWLDLRNGCYSWGWCDSDMQLLYASFNILTRFMRVESQSRSWDHDDEIKALRTEIDALMAWWAERQKRDDDFREESYQEDTDMLIRLMRVRQVLWT